LVLIFVKFQISPDFMGLDTYNHDLKLSRRIFL